MQKNLDVYIFSNPGCGYCRRAFKELGEWAKGKSVNLIAMNVSSKIDKIKESDDYVNVYNKYNIHLEDASECGKKYENFIPKIFVFDGLSGKQKLKKRGWLKGDIVSFQKRLQKYL